MSTAEESISNVSGVTFEGEASVQESLRFILPEIFFTLFAIAGILADIAIIHTILRYKRLQSTKHIFIANWAIADLACLLAAPSGYRIVSTIINLNLSAEFMCVLYEIANTLHMAEIIIVIIITLDWFVGEFFEKIADKYRPYQIKILIGVWCFFLLIVIVYIVACLEESMPYFYKEFVMIFLVLGALAIIFLFQLIRLVQKLRKRPIKNCFILNLVTGFACSYLLGIALIIFMNSLRYFSEFLSVVVICLFFSSSMVNLTLLYFYNKKFQSCFQQTLKRTPNYNDEFSDSETFDDIHVSFNNPKEELLTNAY